MSPWAQILRTRFWAVLRLAEGAVRRAGVCSRSAPAARERGRFDLELVHRAPVGEVMPVRLPVPAGIRKRAHQAEMRLLVIAIGLQDAQQVRDRGVRVG